MVRRIRIAVALLLMVTAAAILIVLQQRPNPVYVTVPTQMTAMIRQFAQADGDGQILAGASARQAASARYVQLAASHPGRLSLGQDAARSIVAMISRDRSASLYTKRVSGFSWDFAQVQVSAPRIAPRTGDSLTFVATITWWFHINGTDRGDGDPGLFGCVGRRLLWHVGTVCSRIHSHEPRVVVAREHCPTVSATCVRLSAPRILCYWGGVKRRASAPGRALLAPAGVLVIEQEGAPDLMRCRIFAGRSSLIVRQQWRETSPSS